jgi:hypothetical protein
MAGVDLNKDMKPKALATALLGGKAVADPKDVKKLTAKIINLNADSGNVVKGQKISADAGPIKVGKINAKNYTLNEDFKDPARYTFYTPPKEEYSVPSVPYIPPPPPIPPSQTSIKIATPDIVLFDEEGIEIEIMADLIFEDIGGQEIINISRNDIVNGQPVFYSPIKNLSKINLLYNSRNLLSVENTADNYFNNFAIELGDKIPVIGTGPNGENIYIDPVTGNLVIDLINIQSGEQIEVEILELGEVLNDTIYGEEI